MQVLEKNIKGFNLLELLIVIVIMGFVSAVAYPNLSGWSKERKARGAAIKIKSLMEKINAQVQRGNYAFVQVFFIADATNVQVKSRGMKISTLNSKINDGGNVWNADATSRCNIISDTYWDDDPDEVSPEAAISDVSKEVDALKEAFASATNQIQNLTGSLQAATIAAATIKIPENFQVNVDELNNRLASASVSVSQVQDVYSNIEKSLDGQPEAHRDVVSASDKLVVQLEEMNSLVKQLNEKYSAISKAMGN